MKLQKFLAAVTAGLLLCAFLCGATLPEEQPDSLSCIQKLLTYYEHYGDRAATDLGYWLAQLKQADPELGAVWEKILVRWSQLDSGMEITLDTLPSDLPQDESLAILVFGYKLNPDATMSSELRGRTEIALAAARQYPNALVVCSGGRTGVTDRTISEAWRIYELLVNRGIPRDKVIMEKKALSTTENVINCLELLAKEYPEVTGIVYIVSDYMVPRVELLLYAQSLLSAEALGSEPVQILGHAAYDPPSNPAETAYQTAVSLAILAGMKVAEYKALEVPQLSVLTAITAEGNTSYTVGEEPQLRFTAQYDSGITRDVTGLVSCSGLDMLAEGTQTLTAQYTEGDVTVTTSLEIRMLPLPTEPPTEPSTEAVTLPPETEPPVPQPEPEAPATGPVAAVAAVSLAALGCIGWFFNKKESGAV